MSEEQFAAFISKLQEDTALQEKLERATSLDSAISIATEAGFNISKSDLMRHQAQAILSLSDQELENIAGGEKDGDQCFVSGGNGYAMVLRIPRAIR